MMPERRRPVRLRLTALLRRPVLLSPRGFLVPAGPDRRPASAGAPACRLPLGQSSYGPAGPLRLVTVPDPVPLRRRARLVPLNPLRRIHVRLCPACPVRLWRDVTVC